MPYFLKPRHILRVYKYEEAKMLHQRALELTSNFNQISALPRVAIHSSISTHTDPYFIALMELRSGTLQGEVVRDDGTHKINDLRPCKNSY
jgi:DNA-directed RNA polymerase subunit K/omega